MSIGERPGIYTSYTTSGIRYGGASEFAVGIAAQGTAGTAGELVALTSPAAAREQFGEGSNLAALCVLALYNGASVVKAVRVTGSYAEAFSLLCADASVKTVTCDSTSAQVHAQLKAAVTGAEGDCAHKLGIVEGSGGVSALVSAAAALNCERIVMTAPGALDGSGSAMTAGSTAAALAGVIVAQSDAALPLNGAALKGLDDVAASYTDGDITLLVRGGVTPLEKTGGDTCVVRGITTRTTTGGVADATWRELNTILVVDDVVPSVREALKSGFKRAKNTAQTRGAIRTRVIIELESKKKAEIIEDYDNVTVAQNADDPTVCDVAFEFTVAHGLNRIVISAFITV